MISNSYTLMSSLVGSSSSLYNQLAQVQEQVASGLVSNTYSGLGSQAETALNLSPEIAQQKTYSTNINAAQARMNVAQSAMTEISSIASNFYSQVNTLNQSDPTSVQTVAQSAQAALTQVADLLNSQSGDVYVFAGQDTSNPPVPNTDPTVLGTALLASTTSTAPFSSTLGTAVPKIEVGNGQWVQVGLLANQNTLVTSASPTTGSYMRDVMTSLANLAKLTPGSTNIASVATTVRGYLSSAISAMGSEEGALGNIQSSLTQQQTNLATVTTTLQTQLSSVEDVDMAATITKSSTLQSQLQASYQIIAQTKGLSLAQYLGS